MTYKTHFSFSLLSTAILLLIFDLKFSPATILMLLLVTALGSSTPDLDTPTGKIWHKIPAGSIFSRIIHPVFIGGHRHLSHSFLGLIIFSFLFYLLLKMSSLFSLYLLLAYAVGYISHLFADMFTETGLPLFFPWGYHFGIPPDPFSKIRIKTGRWFENLVIYPAVNIALVLVVYEYLKKY